MSAKPTWGLYPYAIVRYMSGLRSSRDIELVAVREEHTLKHDSDIFDVTDPTPSQPQGNVNATRREAILESMSRLSQDSGYSICVVFSERDSVYLGATGDRIEADGPPDGTAHIDAWRARAVPPGGLEIDGAIVCHQQSRFGSSELKERILYMHASGEEQLWAGLQFLDGTPFPKNSERSTIELVQVSALKTEQLLGPWRMFGQLVRSRAWHSLPSKILEEGLVTQEGFASIIGQTWAEIQADPEKLLLQKPEIMQVAEKLKLRPQPTESSLKRWEARCPESRHKLWIDASRGQYGCGSCRRMGDADDLVRYAAYKKERFSRVRRLKA